MTNLRRRCDESCDESTTSWRRRRFVLCPLGVFCIILIELVAKQIAAFFCAAKRAVILSIAFEILSYDEDGNNRNYSKICKKYDIILNILNDSSGTLICL